MASFSSKAGMLSPPSEITPTLARSSPKIRVQAIRNGACLLKSLLNMALTIPISILGGVFLGQAEFSINPSICKPHVSILVARMLNNPPSSAPAAKLVPFVADISEQSKILSQISSRTKD